MPRQEPGQAAEPLTEFWAKEMAYPKLEIVPLTPIP